jgi:hypothetical protein
MTIPATRAPHDVVGVPDATTRSSSEEGLHPTMISHSKEDIESTQPMSRPDLAVPPQFPEGGLQAWLTVIGGYAHRFPSYTFSLTARITNVG